MLLFNYLDTLLELYHKFLLYFSTLGSDHFLTDQGAYLDMQTGFKGMYKGSLVRFPYTLTTHYIMIRIQTSFLPYIKELK